MPNCPKCGADVDEKMVFCPKCGAALQTQQPADWRERRREIRNEWRERRRQMKQQRHENEKGEAAGWEKTEKHEYFLIGPLIGGLILIFLGIALYLVLVGGAGAEALWASFLVVVGLIIIVGAIYGVLVAGRRHPKP
ncbi:MAG TPA: zinc ribbon domain-containing protein [Candidatus Acidoferrum sp.]|nr:zinc ribbon domain-containing protein [Candidatus Acidoferrum sp.]